MSERYQKFLQLLDAFPASNQFLKEYIARSKIRGWETFKHLPVAEPGKAKLLDVGSMLGIYGPVYHDLFGYENVELLGNDLSTPFIKRNYKGVEYTFKCGACNIETESWPYPDNSFDMVVCTEVLEHMLFDPVFVMCEMSRVLKDGGRALLTIPNAASDSCLSFLCNDMQPGFLRYYSSSALKPGRRDLATVANMGHFHEYTRSDLECLLEATGYCFEFLGGISPFPPLLNNLRFKLLKVFVHCLFPRAKRIPDDQLIALVRKETYTPCDDLQNRYPEPLYRNAKG